jgi:dipeptidyl aminopeptidase/acylaminoacyl peptidase
VTFTKALRRARKNVEFAQYPSAEHDIRPERYRVDLLTRLGGFLEKNLD